MSVRNINVPHRITEGRHGLFEVNWVFDHGDFASLIDHAVLVTIPPGGSIGEHPHHDSEELYLILEGSGTMYLDEERTPVSEGDLILTAPGHSHRLDNSGEAPVRLFVVNTQVPASAGP
jgi:mannose-6-phosphate isomerase-like protein (cupin superfamily)